MQNQIRHVGHNVKCQKLCWKAIAIPDERVLPVWVCNVLELPSDSRCCMHNRHVRGVSSMHHISGHVRGMSSKRHMSHVHWDVNDMPLVLRLPGHPLQILGDYTKLT
jgi:hypothetical protein